MSNYLALLNYNLTSVNASTINYSTLIGSTIIASSIVSNSSINVNNIIVQNINYSTLTGSTMTTRTINYSTLTGSTILAQAVNYSTMTGSTTTNNTMVVNSTLTGSTMTVQTVNYSTLTGSTMTNNTLVVNSTINVSSITSRAINYSTMTGSTMTINTLVIASTLTVSTLIATNNPAGVITSSMISVGASTNQSYTALAQGNYSTSTNWISTLNNLSSTKIVAMSGNAQTQLAISQVSTISSVYYTSTIGTSWSTISNVTGLPTATQTNYSCGAVSGNGQYAVLGTTKGNLYVTSTLTSAAGPSFTTVYPPPASYIYLPFENSVTDVQGNSVVTATGSPAYVTGIVGSTAINLANTLGGTATQYVRGTWTGLPNNVSLSGWFRATTVSTGSQWGVMFSSHSGNLSLYTEGPTGYLVFLFPSGSGSTFTLIKTSYVITASTWYSFFATFQTNGICSLYVNNILIGTSTNTGGYGSIVSSGYFSLGTYDNGTTLAFNGYIDDFRIYTSATTYSNVALSNSGQYMLATVANGGLYMSSNFGSTWSQVSAALLQAAWSLLEISSTGQYMSVYSPPVTVTPQFTGLPSSGLNLTTSSWQTGGVTWIASASSVYLPSGYPVSAVFDNVYNTWWGNVIGGYTSSGNTSAYSTNIIGVTQTPSTTGDWVQIQSSTPLVMYSYQLANGNNLVQSPKKFYIAGSNDGTNWYPIQSAIIAATTGSTNALIPGIILVNSNATQTFGTSTLTGTSYATTTNTYTYFRIIFTTNFNTSSDYVAISQWVINFTAGGQLYSTNFGSSWGNLLPANTSKLALSGSGQYALENINTTTVTTTPQLTGLAAATTATWNVNGVVWSVSTSSIFVEANGYPTNAFNNTSGTAWVTEGGYGNNITGISTRGITTTVLGIGSVSGDWLQLRSSVPLAMNSYSFMSGDAGPQEQSAKNFYIVGSNDGTNWYPIQYVAGIVNPATSTSQIFSTYFTVAYTGVQIITAGQVGSYYTTAYPTSGNAYTYFRIIITHIFGIGASSSLHVGEWYINFNNVFIQPQLTGLTGVTSGNAVTSWISNNVTWTSSASSVNSAGYQPWIAFNNLAPTTTAGNYSFASAANYNTSSGVYNNAFSTTIAAPYSAAYTGEWLQIQSSVPVVMYNYSFGIGDISNVPKTYLIVGSNDGTTWFPIQLASIATNPFGSTNFRAATSYLLANYTGTQTLTSAAVPAGASVTTTAYSTSGNAYTYFRIIANTTFGGLHGNYELTEWFINFTNTLTSPQVTGLSGSTSGNAVTSWTANNSNIIWTSSASSAVSSLQPWVAFNNLAPTTTAGNYSWASAGNYPTGGTYNNTFSTTIGAPYSAVYRGEWLQIQSSVPVVMYNYTFGSGAVHNVPKTYLIAGSNDNTTWFPIQLASMATNPLGDFTSATRYLLANYTGNQILTSATVPAGATITTTAYSTSSNAYTYFRIIANTTFGGSNYELTEWYINFTTTTVSPQLSGLTGNTSSGTPVPTTWAANNIAWTSSASSVFTTTYQPWLAFDNIGTGNVGPYSWGSSQIYITTSGVYNGSVSTTIAAPYSAAYRGEWLQIQSSVPVVLYNYTFACGGTGNIPKNYLIAGSNDGTTWYPIQLGSMASNPFGSTNFRPATSYLLANYTGSQTLSSVAVPAGVTVTTTSYSTSGNAYTYFRIISNVSFGGDLFELEEWFVNFTPTQYVTSNYLSATSSTPYTAPVFSPALTSTNVPITSAASQTGQYMVLITNNASGANVYYSTNYGANFTGLLIGTSAMVSCAISSDGSYITVMNATTVYQLNNNSVGFSVAVGNQAGQQNQAQNAIAIGSFAGQQNQTANSIVLNATGAALNSYVSGFYVAPIAQYNASSSSSFNLLGYGSDNQIVQTTGVITASSNSTLVFQSALQTNSSLIALGNVGIGTNAPNALLQINSTSVSANRLTSLYISTPESGIILDSTSSAGSRSYNIFSTTAGSGVGAGCFAIFDQTSGLYRMVINTSGNVSIAGSLSKGSGTFDIEHPLYPNTNKRLVHSFIEGPRCDLIYRGTVALTNGSATVYIDKQCTYTQENAMDNGTFEVLCANPDIFLQNRTGFNRVVGSIYRGILTITSENNTATDMISWMVVAERKDPFVKNWDRTDSNGYLNTQYTKDN